MGERLMFDEVRPLAFGPPFGPAGDDRSPPRGLPPEAPLAMPSQVLEWRGRKRRGWLRLLGLRAA